MTKTKRTKPTATKTNSGKLARPGVALSHDELAQANGGLIGLLRPGA